MKQLLYIAIGVAAGWYLKESMCGCHDAAAAAPSAGAPATSYGGLDDSSSSSVATVGAGSTSAGASINLNPTSTGCGTCGASSSLPTLSRSFLS